MQHDFNLPLGLADAGESAVLWIFRQRTAGWIINPGYNFHHIKQMHVTTDCTVKLYFMCVRVFVLVCVHTWVQKLSKRKNIYITQRKWTSAARHVERKREMSGEECREWGVGWGGWCLVVMVTGFDNTAVCCPFAHPWWAAHWCPPHCFLETRHVLIDQRSVSVIRCDRSLQDKAEELISL